MTTRDWRNLCNSGREYLEVDPASIIGLFLASDLVNPQTGEIIAEAGDELTEGLVLNRRFVMLQLNHLFI